MLSSTKKQLQVSRRTYGLGSDGMERSGRQGEASGEINEALNVRPKKQFLGREGKRRAILQLSHLTNTPSRTKTKVNSIVLSLRCSMHP